MAKVRRQALDAFLSRWPQGMRLKAFDFGRTPSRLPAAIRFCSDHASNMAFLTGPGSPLR